MQVIWCALGIIVLLVVGVIGILYWQAKQVPAGRPDYVALGSSFAAGIGLGARAPGSPFVSMRSLNGYPSHLARLRGLSLVDMSSSGATSKHVLTGGQMFLGPQIAAIRPETRLVTLTIGGNDIGYVGDLSILAARTKGGFAGWLTRRITSAPQIDRPRDYDGMRASLIAIIGAVKQRAPHAAIVVAGYPQILPPHGTCAKLALSEGEVAIMRGVGDRLSAVTGEAARAAGVRFVDMQAIGAAHHACAGDPWINGWKDAAKTPFHPTQAGAQATARAIAAALDGK